MGSFVGRLVPRLAVTLALAWPVAAAGQTITVLHVSDTHSHLAPVGPKDSQLAGTLGGLARAVTVIRDAQGRHPDSLLLHAGDLFAGDLFFNKHEGVPELRILLSLGLEAMALGSHELERGPGLLATTAAAAGLPPGFFLAANADTSGCATEPACAPLRQAIQASRIVTVHGVRIGLFGMTTPDDPVMKPAPVSILGRGSPSLLIETALDTAQALRADGADAVILLSHLGLARDAAIAASQGAETLIDFIVGGRDHRALATPVEVHGTRIVSAGEYYRDVGQLRFTLDGGSVRFEDYTLLAVGPEVTPDPATQARVDALEQEIVETWGDVFREVIGEARSNLERDHDPAGPVRDTALGNLVTDAYRFRTRSEIGLTASRYLAERIWQGPIVPADVFRSVSYGYDPATPLGSPLLSLGVTGAELLKAMEAALGDPDASGAFFLQFSGLRYRYDSRRPKMHRIVSGSVYVGSRSIDPARVYSVTASDAVSTLLEQALGVSFRSRVPAGVDEYVALRDYVRYLQDVDARPEGRIQDGGDERERLRQRDVSSGLRAAGARRVVRRRSVVPRRVSPVIRALPLFWLAGARGFTAAAQRQPPGLPFP